MRQSELKELVKRALADAEASTITFRGYDNPQIVELYHKKLGEASAFRAVLNALEGDAIFLRILAGK